MFINIRIKEISKMKLYSQRWDWAMNETLISYKMPHLADNVGISASFWFVEASLNPSDMEWSCAVIVFF